MRLGPLDGMEYVVGAEGYSGQNQGVYRLGGNRAYAAAERSETGKSNDLCSSCVLMFRSLIDSRTQT